MNKSYFQKNFVSLVTLAALMGASQGVLALDSNETDEDMIQPRQLVQRPFDVNNSNIDFQPKDETNQTPALNNRLNLLIQVPRWVLSDFILPHIDAEAGAFLERVYLRHLGGRLPYSEFVKIIREQLRDRVLTPFRGIPIRELQQVHGLVKELNDSGRFNELVFDAQTRKGVIKLALPLFRNTRPGSSFTKLCVDIRELGEDRVEICSETNRLLTGRVLCYDLGYTLRGIAKLGKNRAEFLTEFAPFIVNYIRHNEEFPYVKDLNENAETMITAIKLAKKYGLASNNMELWAVEDLLNLIVTFGEEGESICAAAQPFLREGMDPLLIIKFVKVIHGLGNNRGTILTNLTSLLLKESKVENIIELTEILGTDLEPILTFAITNRFVKTSMSYHEIKNLLNRLKFSGDKRK